MCCMYTVYSGMQEWVIQIPSIPILVSVLFPSLHLKYFRIKFLLLVVLKKPLFRGHHSILYNGHTRSQPVQAVIILLGI